MPYRIVKGQDGKVKVLSPHGVKAKATSPEKAKRQVRLLHGIKHGWTPTGH